MQTQSIPLPASLNIRPVMDTLASTYHGRGAIELSDPYQVLIATALLHK